MSEKFPDKYRGSYNSDQYKIEANSNIAEEYANRENSIGIDSSAILSSRDDGKLSSGIIVESDEQYYKELYSLYANVLNANGMNLLNPYNGYMTHFNKLQRLNVDPPYVGKTYIFITRPDLNFWEMPTGITNVETVDLFNYFSKLKIGISVMPWLMFPHNMKLEFKQGDGSFARTQRLRVGKISLAKYNDPADFGFNTFTPFIPILSNTCVSSSGGPDLSLSTEMTEGDLHGNKLQYAKGADESFEPGEITLEFSDINGLPVMHLCNMWVNYIHYLTKDIVKTWEAYIMYRIIDYTCSVYVFETDRDNTTILRWAKYTGCFPKSVPLGNVQHNMESQPDKLRQLSIPFAYNRCEINKPAALMDFNFLMNKFLLDNDKNNRDSILATGTAPRKIILPYENYDIDDVLSRDPGIIRPAHYEFTGSGRNEEKLIIDNNTNYYDNKFWGLLPYVMNHKLVWIDPKVWYSNYSRIKSRGEAVDSAATTAANNLINTQSLA